MTEYWKNQREAFGRYWAIYGGFRAVLTSPYIHISILLTAITLILGKGLPSSPSDVAVSAVPNLLGFTVGAIAIVLAFSSAPIFEQLAEKGSPLSYFMTLMASLVHFILVQVTALVLGIATKISGAAYLEVPTLFFLFYAVVVTFAAGIQLFLTATIYNAKAGLDAKRKQEATEKAAREAAANGSAAS